MDATDEAVRGMVAAVRPAWSVTAIDHFERGTDAVARVDVTTPTDEQRVVVKAVTNDTLDDRMAAVEPHLLDRLARETAIPVPGVHASRTSHPTHPTPFFVTDYVSGESPEGRGPELPRDVRTRLCRDAGRFHARLHEWTQFDTYGPLGASDGELAVVGDADVPRRESFREWVAGHCRHAIDSLTDGGFFPDEAVEHDRFADLAVPLREWVAETIPALPEPEPPRPCHSDYRYGNLLVDTDTGETRAVIDWERTLAADPAYNLASTESLLFSPEREPDETVAHLRDAFRSAYADARAGWTLDAATDRRIDVYRVVCRVDAMACLPFWHATAELDDRETDHRAFLARHGIGRRRT